MTVASDDKALQATLNGVDIPPCPAVLLELEAELAKPNTDQRELARLITRDVALSGHVMQVANSPAFSTGQPLTSIIHALNVLGTRQVFSLLVAQLLKAAVSGKQEASMERFWETSAQTARLAAEIARRLRCVRPDIAYTFGLFRDCGIPILMANYLDYIDILRAANSESLRAFTEIEDEEMGVDHASIGATLAREWRLPIEYQAAIEFHHDSDAVRGASAHVMPDVARYFIALAQLAEYLFQRQTGLNKTQEWGKLGQACLDLLLLQPSDVDALQDTLAANEVLHSLCSQASAGPDAWPAHR